MSNVIDERVVKMEFDNSDFDKNINASQKSLNAFNDYLEKSSKESGGYFERIGDHATNIAEWVIFSLKKKEDQNEV